jgi:alpha-tubulin suppressor-like RCC1 family protein
VSVATGFSELQSAGTSGGTGCALLASHTLECWGWNPDGELGDGKTSNKWRLTPVAALATNIVSYSGGWVHTCVVTNGGAVLCWGSNGYGQLGDGTSGDSSPTPVSPIASGAIAVAAGAAHTCALMQDDRVLCWGTNLSGDLGVNIALTPESNVPVEVTGM